MPLNTIPNTGLTSRGYPSDRLVTPIIINGDMSVAQRGTSTASITGNGYAIDRFRHQITSAGTWTISQSTDVPTGQGFAYSQKWDCTTADASLGASDRARMMQRIEGNTLAALKYNTSSAESITISFWVKSNKTGTYSWSANDNSNAKLISASYTIDSANTWEKKILSFAGTNSPSISINNTDFLQCSWWLGAGSTYSGGTYRSTWTALSNSDEAAGQTVNLADSTDNEWYITGVQLEVGEFDSTTIPSFPFESFENNLLKCQRYYEKSYKYSVAPGTSTTNGITRIQGTTDESSNFVILHPYMVQKRTESPTQTFYQSGGTSGSWNCNRSGSNITASANNWELNGKRQSAYFTFGSAHNYGAGYVYGHWTADAEL